MIQIAPQKMGPPEGLEALRSDRLQVQEDRRNKTPRDLGRYEF
jgi:hypothetical protein